MAILVISQASCIQVLQFVFQYIYLLSDFNTLTAKFKLFTCKATCIIYIVMSQVTEAPSEINKNSYVNRISQCS